MAQSCQTLCGPKDYTAQGILQASILEFVSCFLLQGIFPIQGSNPGLPHCRWILFQLSHKGSPRILEWVACPFSSGSSQPRNRTGFSCIAGGYFTSWVTVIPKQILPNFSNKILINCPKIYFTVQGKHCSKQILKNILSQ